MAEIEVRTFAQRRQEARLRQRAHVVVGVVAGLLAGLLAGVELATRILAGGCF